jgi:transcriptional regulator with XRE-family HTH domain
VKVNKKEIAAFCARIRQLRLSKKMTQKDLAALIDVDERTIRNIESGVKYPTLPTILGLAKALKVNAKDLF